MGNHLPMKTSVDIADDLFARLKRMSRATGMPMRTLIEEGLRRVLDTAEAPEWRLEDRTVGHLGGVNPLESLSWQDLRDEIYGPR